MDQVNLLAEAINGLKDSIRNVNPGSISSKDIGAVVAFLDVLFGFFKFHKEFGYQRKLLLENQLAKEREELLGELGSHIRALLMTESGKLTGYANKIESLVFPLEIDGAIR